MALIQHAFSVWNIVHKRHKLSRILCVKLCAFMHCGWSIEVNWLQAVCCVFSPVSIELLHRLIFCACHAHILFACWFLCHTHSESCPFFVYFSFVHFCSFYWKKNACANLKCPNDDLPYKLRQLLNREKGIINSIDYSKKMANNY